MEKKKIRNIVWIGLLLVGLVLLGYRVGWFDLEKMGQSKESAANTQSSSPPTKSSKLPVTAIVVYPSTLEDLLIVSGNLEADEEVEIKSEIDGVILEVNFQEGRNVQKGERLIKIEDDDLKAQIQRTQYQIDLVQQQENRRKKLLDKGGVSQEEYDEILTQVNTLKAELAILEVDLEKTEITAPFDGKIGFKMVSEGSYLSPGTSIARMVKLNPIKVSFSVPEKYSQQIQVGNKVSFSVEGMSNAFTGGIFAKEPFIDPDTRTQLIKARSANTRGTLLPGSFCTVSIQLESFDEALNVPTEAVIPELGGKKLYVVEEGVAKTKTVETGIRRSEKIQVVSGLEAGDTVITSGILQLKEGMPVEVTQVLTE